MVNIEQGEATVTCLRSRDKFGTERKESLLVPLNYAVLIKWAINNA